MVNRWLRKLRGALGIGSIWGAVGSVVGGLAGVLASVVVGAPLVTGVVAFGLGAGVVGFALGTGFAALLGMGEGRTTLEDLTSRRAAAWGAVAGALGPAAVLALHSALGWGGDLSAGQWLPVVLGATGSYAALTAALAAGTVALAKRSPGALTAGGNAGHPQLQKESEDRDR